MMKTEKLPKWIPVHEAAQIEGSGTVKDLNSWLIKWNNDPTTANKVLRRYGKVELNSLLAAIAEDVKRFNRSGQQAQAFVNQQAFGPRPTTPSHTERRINA